MLKMAPKLRGLGKRGEPVWDVARLYPSQGDWTEEEYLELEQNSANQMIELVDGFIEFLPMPDLYHQRIVLYSYHRLHDFAANKKLGEPLVAPLPVRLWDRQMREPDIIFVKAHRAKNPRKPPDGADLVMEVVSPGAESRERDLDTKRKEYAKAKIPEYWIIDPEKRRILVLVLGKKSYRVHGEFSPGEQATSVLLPGFAVDVTAVFAAGEGAL